MEVQPVLVAGEWRKAAATSTFAAEDPTTGKMLDGKVSSEWMGGL